MADYERYSRNPDEGRMRRLREDNDFDNRRLDDRTGASSGSPGGYRAAGRDSYGARGNYIPRDYDRGGAYAGREEGASFGTEWVDNGSYYGAASGGQDAYGGDPWAGTYSGYNSYRGATRHPARNASPSQGRDYQDYRGRTDHGRDFFERASDEVSSWFGDEAAHLRREGDGSYQREAASSHRGKGPKGYKRSDDRIREDVSDRLSDDHHIDASNIEVMVADGEVTLSGKVASRHAKHHAEHLAEDVSGVDHVQNNLRVDKDMEERPNALGTSGTILSDQAAGRA